MWSEAYTFYGFSNEAWQRSLRIISKKTVLTSKEKNCIKLRDKSLGFKKEARIIY